MSSTSCLSFIFFILLSINYIEASNSYALDQNNTSYNNNVDVTLRFIDTVQDLVHTVGHIEISQDLQSIPSAPSEQGRGAKGLRLAIPLIIGFKIASVITAAIAGLKLLVFNTIIFSGASLLASLALFAKYVFEKLSKVNQHHSAIMESSPYHSASHFHQQQYGWGEPAYSDSDVAGSQPELLSQYSSQLSSNTITDNTNASSYSLTPSGSNERKSYYRSPVIYKTTLYKTTIKHSDK